MLPISQYRIGMSAEVAHFFSDSDIQTFSVLTGDINPVHINDEYAKNTIFGSRIVHGALASSIFSTIFANKLPGEGCIYLKSENKFLKPIYLNTEVIFKVEVVDILYDKKRVIFNTTAISKSQKCIVGSAELYIPE